MALLLSLCRAGVQVTSSTADAVPLSLKGKALSAIQLRLDLQCRVRHFRIAASEALPRCPAGRSPSPSGWVGGVYPSAPIKARTAASDGHCASTRAARSAGLNFAVIVLSKAMDVGRDHLIHRKRSPFPEKTEWRVKSGEWS